MPDVTLIPGDGVGPEVVAATRLVLDNATSQINWDVVDAGEEVYRKVGAAVPREVVESLERTRLGLKGPMGVPKQGYPSPNTEIRIVMGLWCNLRMAIHFEGARSRYPGTRIVLMRDVTEDLGRGAQQMVGADAGIAIRATTRPTVERLTRFALGYARDHGINRITVPNYAPVLRTTDGLFVATAQKIAADEFPDLSVDEEAMDSVATHLAMRPEEYPMFMSPNIYGGILCGLCAGLVGGVGLMPGVNLDGSNIAVFEPGHGSAPKYAGLNKVNPTGTILSGAMLLERIGELDAARRVWGAVATVMREREHVTYDQDGNASTSEMAEAVVRHLDD